MKGLPRNSSAMFVKESGWFFNGGIGLLSVTYVMQYHVFLPEWSIEILWFEIKHVLFEKNMSLYWKMFMNGCKNLEDILLQKKHAK